LSKPPSHYLVSEKNKYGKLQKLQILKIRNKARKGEGDEKEKSYTI